MNRDRLQGIWKQYKGSAKQCWGTLSGDSNVLATGLRDMRDGRIEERCGIAKEQTYRQLQDFISRNRNWWDISRR